MGIEKPTNFNHDKESQRLNSRIVRIDSRVPLEYIHNQFSTLGVHSPVLTEYVGFEAFGDISVAVDMINDSPTYKHYGQIDYWLSEDQSTPDESDLTLAEVGLVRADFTDGLSSAFPDINSQLQFYVFRVYAERVIETAYEHAHTDPNRHVYDSLYYANIAFDAMQRQRISDHQ